MTLEDVKFAEAYREELQKHFPTLSVGEVTPSHVDGGESYWVFVDYPDDSEQMAHIRSVAADLSMQFLHDHRVLIMPVQM